MHRAFASFASASPRRGAHRSKFALSRQSRLRVTPDASSPPRRRDRDASAPRATADDGEHSVWLDVTALGRHRASRRASGGEESVTRAPVGRRDATSPILGLLTTPRTRAGGRRARAKRILE